MRNIRNLGRFASMTAIGVSLCSAPAFAQDGSDPATEEEVNEGIIVTGSLIRGTPEDAALPVDVFSTETLDQSGVSSPLEFIKDLPSVGAVLGDSNQFSSAAQGFQGNGSINLRGLGSTRTLVLFNGRRTTAAPGDGFADTNLIPFFALERIELLKDGAAATYGSDAIAGVANFIPKSNFTGVELAGDYEIIDGSDGNWTTSVLVGQNFGAANIMAGFGWQHRSELPTTERAFTQQPYAVNPSGFSTLGNPGTYLPRLGDISQGLGGTVLGVGSDASLLDACETTGGTLGVASGFPTCRFTYIPFNNLIEEEDRYQGYVQAEVDLSDTLKFHADFTYSKTDLESIGTSPSYPPTQSPRGSGSTQGFLVPRSNPGFDDFLTQTFDPSSPAFFAGYASTLFIRPLGNGGNPRDERGSGRQLAKNEAFRASAGFEKEFSDSFRGSFYTTWWRSEREAFSPGIVGSRLQAALEGFGGPDCTGTVAGANGCQYFNPFFNSAPTNPTLGLTNPAFVPGNENSAELVEWLQVRSGTFQTEEQFVVDLQFAGETNWELGGGAVAYAFGAQYRENDFSSRPLDQATDLNVNPCFIEGDLSCVGTATEGVGSLIFLGGTRRSTVGQNVKALFAEVNLPVSDTFEINGAVRFEDYGGSVGSTFNPKAAVRWEATDFLVLRGSVGTTFAGPRAVQVDNNSVTTLAGIQAANNNFKSVDIFGNPTDLGPETAFTYNIGAVVDAGGFTVSADYWSFDFEDRITTTPAQAIASSVVPTPGGLANCSAPLVDLVVFQGGCVQGTTTGLDISRVSTQWVNGPSVKTSGIDISIDYTTDVAGGTLSIGGNASHVLEYEFDDFILEGVTVQQGYDAVGFANFFRDPNTVAAWRANGYVNFNISGINLRYGLQYIDGVTDDRCVNVDPCATTEFGGTNFGAEIGSYTQHDFNVVYELPFDAVDAQLQFSVENFTDEEPAPARLELGYNPFIGNALGRTYRFGIKTKF